MSDNRRTSLVSTYFVSRASDDICSAGIFIATLCCLCAAENADNIRESNCPAFTLKSAMMLIGFGVGLYAAVTCPVPLYNAIYEKMMEDSEAAEWSIKMLSGITTGVIEVILPFAGANVGGWSARAIEAGCEGLSPYLEPVSSAAKSIFSRCCCFFSFNETPTVQQNDLGNPVIMHTARF
jgi:hypothetical protein